MFHGWRSPTRRPPLCTYRGNTVRREGCKGDGLACKQIASGNLGCRCGMLDLEAKTVLISLLGAVDEDAKRNVAVLDAVWSQADAVPDRDVPAAATRDVDSYKV